MYMYYYLLRYEKNNLSIGIILCADKSKLVGIIH